MHYNLRKKIEESWSRCKEYGFKREDNPKIKRIKEELLQKRLEKNNTLINIAKEYIKDIRDVVDNIDGSLILTDNEGVLLAILSNEDSIEELKVDVGCYLNEECLGTSGTGVCIQTQELSIVNGNEHYLQCLKKFACVASPLFDSRMNFVGVLCLVTSKSNTELNIVNILNMAAKSIEREFILSNKTHRLSNSNESLEELSKSIIEGASVLSHEVRNSLSNISAYVQLIQLDSILKNHEADRILNEVKRANKTISGFRRLTKLFDISLSHIKLSRTIEKAVNSMDSKASINNVKLKYVNECEDAYVVADREGLHHVITNLIENSIAAIPSKGEIVVSTNIDNNDVLICIKDNGQGIPSDKMDKIFKLFFTTKSDGSGIGLALSKYVIERHNGTIEIESFEGKGTCIYIRLPLVKNKKSA